MPANTLAVMTPEGGLSRYLTEIRKFPMLAKDEEFMLGKAWREHEDPQAAHRLVTSHLRLVAKIAMGYRGYGLPIGEVISEGNGHGSSLFCNSLLDLGRYLVSRSGGCNGQGQACPLQ